MNDNRCRGCSKFSEYVYCDKCAKNKKCPHGNVIAMGVGIATSRETLLTMPRKEVSDAIRRNYGR